MPNPCFSYPADVPPGISNRGAAQPAPPGLRRMTYTACFSYLGDMPPTPRRMTYSTCFRYPGNVPQGPRRMAFGTCFKY
jgi:hypothetical protein